MESTQAGTVTETVNADSQGEQASNTNPETLNTTEADTQERIAESASGEETGGDESQSGNEGKQKHQTTFEERLKQIEAKSEAKIAELQRQFESRQTAEVKPFIAIDMAKVNEHLAEMKDAITDAELKGDFVAALDLEDQLKDLRSQLKANEKLRTEWESKQTAQQKTQQETDAKLKRLDDSAEFYRAQKNIPVDAWEASGKWINEQFQKDPLLAKQFTELVDRQGEIAAIKWADEFVQKNMGVEAKADKASKEAGKAGLLPAGTVAANGTAITSFKDLMARPGAEIIKFEKENPAAFQKLKEAHFK